VPVEQSDLLRVETIEMPDRGDLLVHSMTMSYDLLTLSTIVRKDTNSDALGIVECLPVAFEPYRHMER
jgi:hypothetical protein